MFRFFQSVRRLSKMPIFAASPMISGSLRRPFLASKQLIARDYHCSRLVRESNMFGHSFIQQLPHDFTESQLLEEARILIKQMIEPFSFVTRDNSPFAPELKNKIQRELLSLVNGKDEIDVTVIQQVIMSVRNLMETNSIIEEACIFIVICFPTRLYVDPEAFKAFKLLPDPKAAIVNCYVGEYRRLLSQQIDGVESVLRHVAELETMSHFFR